MISVPSALVLLAASLLSSESAGPADTVFHVSLAGDDTWSGTRAAPAADGRDGPFATVGRAQRAARAALARPGRVVVRIGPGVHELDAPLVFRPEDSGGPEPGAEVVWEGDPDGRSVLSGGRRIEGWRVGEDGAWRVTLPEVRDGAWSFAQLWVDGQRRFRPRVPARGYFTVAEEISPTAPNASRGHDRLGVRPGDVDPTWYALGEVEVMAFHIWSASRMRIASLDEEARVLTFTGPTRTTSPWGAFRKGSRYFVANVREALDTPGEWYLDRATGELTYLPRPGERPDTTRVVAPRLATLVRFEGDVKRRAFVHDVILSHLVFAHTNWVLPPAGQSFPQAEVHLGAAIEARGARGVRLIRCEIVHTGGYGIAFGAGCRDCAVEDGGLADLGAGGIKLGTGGGTQSWMIEGFDPADPESTVEGVRVDNTRIAHGGRLHPAAVGVWIGHASHCRVRHCEIDDFYYTGVSVGWTWGYAEPSRAHHNEIAFNRISRIGRGVLSDLAGVYTLGVSPGTTVHHNVIHDVDALDYGGWGLYTDEGSTDIEMTHNLVYRTKTGGFHQHYGRDNVIAHNIFAEARVQQVQRTRTEDHRSFTFERNIVHWTNESPLLGSNWRDDHFVLDRNVYWNPRFPAIRFPGNLDLEQWRARRGHDLASVVADPLFLAPADDDYRLDPRSPALALGFEPWNHAAAGVPAPAPGAGKGWRPLDALPPVPAGFD